MANNCDVILRFDHVNKTFNPGSINETTVFDDFNLTLRENDFLSIIGSNGSGKTTLLNLLYGTLTPDSGDISLRGKSLLGLKQYQRAAFIGRVYQDPAHGTCSELSILENMALSDNKSGRFGLGRGVNKKRIDYYKSQLELLHIGLENKIEQPVGALSGGQRQALALLLATMTPLDLLILDEHTAALDPKSSENVMELTDRFVREKQLTTIMVTHNLRFAVNYGNRILLMHEGHAVIDAADEAKQQLDINDLLNVFNEISLERGN